MAVLTYGIFIPSGLFVPIILSGSCMGRIFGTALYLLFDYKGLDVGTFAFMGAAAFLGNIFWHIFL